MNGLSSMHKQEVLRGLNGWERKVVGEDKIKIGGEGIGVGLAKAYCIHVPFIASRKNSRSNRL